MEAPTRLFNSSYLNSHLSACKSFSITASRRCSFYRPNPIATPKHHPKGAILSNQSPITPFNTLLSFSSSSLPFNFSINLNPFPLQFQPFSHNGLFEWNPAPPANITHAPNPSFVGNKDHVVTVVLLGWLGAKAKHLRRYVEWYNSSQIHAVTFTVEVRELLWFDLGERLEKRISALVNDLIFWASQKEDDGRERRFIFHTFSNTGWLVYGAILDSLQCRGDILEKIKGCVVDSGAGDPLNPQVWAAGFSVALLKKRSSATYLMFDSREIKELDNAVNASKIVQDPLMIETMLLSVLDKFFSLLLKFPDVKQRLEKIIHVLTNNQPSCPQLYLYSTADNVVPSQSIKLFIESQRRIGKKVSSFDFGTSPHVDHYRTFPTIYSSQLHSFFKECFPSVKLA